MAMFIVIVQRTKIDAADVEVEANDEDQAWEQAKALAESGAVLEWEEQSTEYESDDIIEESA